MQKHKIIKEGSPEHPLLECCRRGSLEEARALLDADPLRQFFLEYGPKSDGELAQRAGTQ